MNFERAGRRSGKSESQFQLFKHHLENVNELLRLKARFRRWRARLRWRHHHSEKDSRGKDRLYAREGAASGSMAQEWLMWKGRGVSMRDSSFRGRVWKLSIFGPQGKLP